VAGLVSGSISKYGEDNRYADDKTTVNLEKPSQLEIINEE
jgi:hypothetical protein